MEEENISKQIKKLMSEKKDVLKELEDLQNDCSHKNGYDVKFIGNKNEVRRVCKDCDSVIGYPSKEELKENGFI